MEINRDAGTPKEKPASNIKQSNNTTKLNLALEYAEQGLAVFPVHGIENGRCSCGKPDCSNPGKHPKTKNGFKDATLNGSQIQLSWSFSPGANIGIATGKISNMFVLDADPRNGSDNSLKELENRYGPLPPTFTVSTGGGGFHKYYQYPSSQKLSSCNPFPGIDIKADGGYVVGAGSIHKSGSYYELNGERKINPAPEWLIDIIQRSHCINSIPEFKKMDLNKLRVSERVKKIIVDSAPKGDRSENVFSVTRAMVVADHTDEEIFSVLTDPNYKISEKPLENGTAWLQAEIRRARNKPLPSTSDSRLIRMDRVEAEEVEWFWEPYIPLGKVTCIEGDPGIGKSFLTMELAAAVSLGNSLPGGSELDVGNVLLISMEDGLGDTIRPRLDILGAKPEKIFAIEGLLTSDKQGLEILEKSIQETQPKLVIIDPLTAYMGAGIDQNKATQVRSVMQSLAVLAERYKCAIVVVRHLSKSGPGKAIYRGLGSIDISAACRSVLMVALDPNNTDLRVIAQTKMNLAPKGVSQVYIIKDGKLDWSGEADITADELCNNLPSPTTELSEAMQFITRCLQSGKIPATEVQLKAKSEGFSERTITRAKKKLNIKSKKIRDTWYWLSPAKTKKITILAVESGNSDNSREAGNVDQLDNLDKAETDQHCQDGQHCQDINV